MKTSPHGGTPVNLVLRGIKNYLDINQITYTDLRYVGLQNLGKTGHEGVEVNIHWLVDNLATNKVVWLNLGWYTRQGSFYQRDGGHWVSLVGYGGKKLFVHDPGPWQSAEAKQRGYELQYHYPQQLIWWNEVLNPQTQFLSLVNLRPEVNSYALVEGAIALGIE